MTAKIPPRASIVRRKKGHTLKGQALPSAETAATASGAAPAQPPTSQGVAPARQPDAPPAAPTPEVPERQTLDGAALMSELDGMSAADFAALMGAGMPVRHAPGDRVEGKVVRVSGNTAFIDIGGKSEGLLVLENASPGDLPRMGEVVRAYVSSVGDEGVRLSRSLGGAGAWDALEAAKESGETIEGKVTARNPGGFTVRMGAVSAFCPVSHIDRLLDADLDSYIGRTLAFQILEIRDRDVVVSHRAVAQEAVAEKADALWARVEEGDMLDGVVAAVKDFGAFIDVDGVRGLVPRREIGWGHDAEAPPPGAAVRVRVIGVDRAANRLTLSLRDEGGGPWSRVGNDFLVGGDYTGKVTRVTDFGAFVSLAPGLEGLVHISELSEDRVARTADAATAGETIQVRLLDIDFDRQRLQLSRKQVGKAGGRADREAAPRDTGKLGTFGDLFAGLKLR